MFLHMPMHRGLSQLLDYTSKQSLPAHTLVVHPVHCRSFLELNEGVFLVNEQEYTALKGMLQIQRR
jgi:hypothetical protein